MTAQTIALFSVKHGKFHKPAETIEAAAVRARQPIRTMCGVSATPVNYFATEDDASRYTGGRLAAFMCQHCRASAENGLKSPRQS
jgi:hypothetical protein